MSKKIIYTIIILCLFFYVKGQNRHSSTSSFPSYSGLVMAGYQGWFNAPGDGANMGWNHYATKGLFKPGFCKVDFWPDVSEYAKTYPTDFKFDDGKPAYIFSSSDAETVALHFKWMQQYGIDGVFVQRAVISLKNPNDRAHINRVLQHAIAASREYHRAIAIMYDFSGLSPENDDWNLIIDDWKFLVDSMQLTAGGNHQTYLYHHNKPLVGIWGVGFPDRMNDLKTTEKIIHFLKQDELYGNCAVLLGVPAYWRDFGRDTQKDPFLHELIREVDIVRPWFVGRFNEQTYPAFRKRIQDDLKWCRHNGIDYAPVIFPGFSWHNMHPESAAAQIPRNRGRFYWQQLTGAMQENARMLYVAMFDEIDEGTAIFKIAAHPPVGASKFEILEPGIPTDYYLFLTGMAGKMLKKQIPIQLTIPPPMNAHARQPLPSHQ